MKKSLLIIILLVPFSCSLIAQKSDKFVLEKKKGSYYKEGYVILKEPRFPIKIDLPEDEKGARMTYEDIIAPFARISQIADSVFNKEEIVKLKKYHYCATFIVSSSGKIEFVSFKLFDPNPEIDIEKMEIFGKVLKKEISFKVKFPRKVEKEGYVPYSVWIYMIIPYDKTRFYKSQR